ncbi:MAG: hypothetical protein QM299_00005 [Pseudomonadota bacterium]|nr:hypothetical protein [Pseudomonadota bacterium]HPX18173.1 hypothetical protein [Deltaproteobacteria bacterium]
METGEVRGLMDYVWLLVSWGFAVVLFGIPIIGFFHSLYGRREYFGALVAASGICFLAGFLTERYLLCLPLAIIIAAVVVIESFTDSTKREQ